MVKRDSRFELLRIISMFCILLFHFNFYSQAWRLEGHHSFWYYFQFGSQLGLGKLGVYLFIMITGYFIGNKSYSVRKGFKKALYIWCEAFWYSSLIFIIALQLGLIKDVTKEALLSFLPFINSAYWFVDAYIVLMLLVHFINPVLINSSKKDLQVLILITSILACVLSPINSNIFTNELQFGYILPAYLAGAYIKKYPTQINYPLWKALIVYSLSSTGAAILYLLGKTTYITLFYYGIFQLLTATYIFIYTVQLRSFHNKAINRFSRTIFASYLITDNDVVKGILWNLPLFHNDSLSLLMVTGASAVIVCLLIVGCSICDEFRILIFKLITKLAKRHNNIVANGSQSQDND